MVYITLLAENTGLVSAYAKGGGWIMKSRPLMDQLLEIFRNFTIFMIGVLIYTKIYSKLSLICHSVDEVVLLSPFLLK